MTRLELLAVFYALKSLLSKGLYEEAEELVDKVISEAERIN